MPQVKIQTAKTPDRIDYMFKLAETEITNKIGIRVTGKLNDKDLKKLQDLMAKKKKPVDFCIDFDGEWFTFSSKVANNKGTEVSVNIGEDNSIKDKEKVLKKLLQYKAATPALIAKYRKKYPDG